MSDEKPPHPLTDEQIEIIAEKAVDKAFDRIAMEVGKSVLKRIAYLAGAAVLALALWLVKEGKWS